MVLLSSLVEVSERIAASSRKKEKVLFIARFLREARGKEIALSASYLSGELPQGRLGAGWQTLKEALEGFSPSPQPVSIIRLDEYFESIAREKGPGSQERKIGGFRDLFARVNDREREFLIRLILGEIRHGALEGLVIEAISQASSLSLDRVRQAFMFSGRIGDVARAALEEGPSGLSRFQPEVFRPISPMLASRAEGEEEALARLGEAGWEFKIDGARIQVHKRGEEVRIFSRNLRDITESVPEIVALSRGFPLDEAIFEGEVVALREDKRPFPFQTTMRRFGRIRRVEEAQKKIALAPYFFDLLFLDGKSLVEMPYRERTEVLLERVPEEHRISRIITADPERVADFLQMSLKSGHEGLMAKRLDSPYIAGQRGFLWLKLKSAQSLDLVVLAAEWGHGRRKGFLSNLHLGARDPQGQGFVMLGKTFKGLTDEMLRWQTAELLKLEIARDEWTVFVRPELVVEIDFSDIQESPRYPGGLALRFARVKRYRVDKSPPETDTIDTVRRIFETARA